MSCLPDWHQVILPQEILHILIRLSRGRMAVATWVTHRAVVTQGLHSEATILHHTSLSFMAAELIRRNVMQALLVGHVCNPST